jgi:hypothetical protein
MGSFVFAFSDLSVSQSLHRRSIRGKNLSRASSQTVIDAANTWDRSLTAMGNPDDMIACCQGESASTCVVLRRNGHQTITEREDCSWVMCRIYRLTTRMRPAMRRSCRTISPSRGQALDLVLRCIVPVRTHHADAGTALATLSS